MYYTMSLQLMAPGGNGTILKTAQFPMGEAPGEKSGAALTDSTEALAARGKPPSKLNLATRTFAVKILNGAIGPWSYI